MSQPEIPVAPDHLSDRGAGLWTSIAGAYELGDHQLELLRRACEASDRTDEAVAIIKAEGLVVVDRYGQSKPHPATQIERDSRVALARLIRELALEPGAGEARPPRTGETKAGSRR
jgi:P27 family predicted phage terminase small subunit